MMRLSLSSGFFFSILFFFLAGFWFGRESSTPPTPPHLALDASSRNDDTTSTTIAAAPPPSLHASAAISSSPSAGASALHANSCDDGKRPAKVRHVRLTNYPAGGILQLSEVEALNAAGMNVARGKPCSSSPALPQCGCETIIDGVVGGAFFHSVGDALGEFVEVDLGAEVELANVTVHNRNDSSGTRMEGQQLLLLDASRSRVAVFGLHGVLVAQLFDSRCIGGTLAHHDAVFSPEHLAEPAHSVTPTPALGGDLPSFSKAEAGSGSKLCASTTAMKSVSAYYDRFIPLRTGQRWIPRPGVRSDNNPSYYFSELDWATCPLAAGEPGFKYICNPDGPCTPPDAAAAHVKDALPHTTATNESVKDAIQRALRAAWGPDPPHIDLYFRAGCGATTEIAYLLPTVELFWPEFLGEVIIALDAGNNATLDFFLPPDWRHTRQSYRFVYEDTPCLPGRIFNQVSYLNLDMHSHGQYVVTFDSDCALHSPVTPYLLFDDRGKLLLPHSNDFQRGTWDSSVKFFIAPGAFQSHSMVSQPIAFAHETFAAYRAWVAQRSGGECYYDTVVRFVNTASAVDRQLYCWMCQLLTFMQFTQTLDKYALVDLDNKTGAVYQRYAIHTTWERHPMGPSYGQSSQMVVREGLCRALGADYVPECCTVNVNVVDALSFSYAGWPWINCGSASHREKYVEMFRLAEVATRRRC